MIPNRDVKIPTSCQAIIENETSQPNDQKRLGEE